MRLIYCYFSCCALVVFAQSSWANTSPAHAPAAAAEQAVPDAMSRIIKAPSIDLTTMRDPFLSEMEKNRIEEARRFKSRRKLPGNSRQREILEYYDLSTLHIVATYKKHGQDWVASLQDSSGKAFTVRRGNYLGKRSGRIEKIDSTTIYLVEQMINPAGDIVDRQVTLTLSEVND